MKSIFRSRKILFLLLPLGLLPLAWFGLPILMENFSYRPETDYQAILRISPTYDLTETVNLSFSYESADSPGLTRLRETYRLDEIAGPGSSLEQAKNLIEWVHDLIPHDGSQPLPRQRDAISLIEHAQSSGQGLNCRGLAIILSESLLSVGIQSRIVELLPRDFSTDSHVVTLAYLPELERWVFFDPSYQAYFVNAVGQYQGIADIRANLINRETLIANLEINYNGGPVDVDYPNYLSKNLYRFASPLYSGFGSDSSENRKMVVLNPAGNNTGRGGLLDDSRVIHNPDVFWAKP
jgi:transglutaminase-like putative cysteine protease